MAKTWVQIHTCKIGE